MSSNHMPDVIARALQVTEQGLKSMQALQLQTAEAHQKFLETQAETAKALQEMITNTRNLTSPDMGQMPAVTQSPAVDAPIAVEKPEPVSEKAVEQSPVVTTAQEPAKKADSDPHTDHLTHTLLSVVSRLTGYPEEMLGMEMDIESDLGIDSIKRVEILSAMEEAIQGLPTVSPEMMGSLKTLGQIVAHLSSNGPVDDNESGRTDIMPQTEPVPTPAGADTRIKETLLSTVGRLTGYPEEMLGMEMDIESDLGIDSIKRVEILSAMEEAIPGLPAVSPDIMGNLKTLGMIVDYLSSDTSLTENTDNVPIPDTPREALRTPSTIDRFLVTPVVLPPKAQPEKTIPLQGTVYITDDGAGLSRAVADAFQAAGMKSELISWESVSDIRSGHLSLDDTCGLVIIPDFSRLSDDGSDPGDLTLLKDAFSLTRHVGPGLLKAAASGGALFATVTRLDGAFGFSENALSKPVSGGLAGLAKTAALEWATVQCRALDISPEWDDMNQIAARVVSELIDAGPTDTVEVGITPSGRTTLGISSNPLLDNLNLKPDMTPGDVVVISGGARGVTAACALALARSVQPTLVLLGRSPEPFAEPEWASNLSTAKDLKGAIIKNEFTDKSATPKEVEAFYKRLLANREITDNINAMRNLGCRVQYVSTDIRNLSDVTRVLGTVRDEYGPVTGIIHGAGVLEDKLIIEKNDTQFEHVIETKLKGLQVLIAATKKDPIKYLILFSSVAARFGNAGQADYAMANEVLNKIARWQTTTNPDRKTIAINWGPWDGGMVTDSLKQEFKRKQIDLISLDDGTQFLLGEMVTPDSPAEVIIGAPLQKEAPSPSDHPDLPQRSEKSPDNINPLRVMLNRDIDLEQYPVLSAHQLDGTPVVPFALLTEWVGHCALHDNPGLLLQSVEDMRLLKGIRMDVDKKVIRLLAGKAKKRGSTYEVDVEIRNGIRDVKEVLHSNARALLSDRLHTPPDYDLQRIASFPSYKKSIKDVYENILFHGHALQGILKIIGLSAKGMAAEVAPAPSPEMWMTHPMRGQWIADPLILDSAFQMACVWCYEQKGMVSLPSFVSSFRQYCRKFPTTPVTAILEVSSVTEHKMTGDVTILDSNNKVAAELKGYEAIMDINLFKAFKPDLAKSA